MSTIKTWDFFNRNVQGGMLEGRFMSAAYTLIAAGPPRLGATSQPTTSEATEIGDIAFPIGVLQNFNIGQNSQWMRVWEIGSERSYFLRGRTMGQIGLGRIVYHGPSLLRVLYAYIGCNQGSNQFDPLYAEAWNQMSRLNTSGREGGKQDYAYMPGYENLWIDLASDVFTQPIGLLVYFRDSNGDTVGAFYVEYAVVTNHGIQTDAGGTIITENAALLYERLLPVDVQAVALIKDSSDVASIVGSADVIGSAA